MMHRLIVQMCSLDVCSMWTFACQASLALK